MTDRTLPDGSTVDETNERIIAVLRDVFPTITDHDITIDDAFPEWDADNFEGATA